MTNMLPGSLGASMTYWFRSPRLDGRVRGAGYILADGSLVAVDLTNWAHRPPPVGAVGYVLECKQGWSASVWSSLFNGIVEASGPTPDHAVYAVRVAVEEQEAEEQAIRANPVTYLERELATHDWWGCMSDSFGVEQAADRHMKEIVCPLLTAVPADTVRALWATHAPKEFPCPV